MTNKFYFKALDKSLKYIISETNNVSKQKFEGKVIVFGGDFRPILHVIPMDSRFDIVHCKILRLIKNM